MASGFVGFLFAVACSLAASLGTAEANPKYAAFVMHEGTGDVLFSRYADERRYPASLTKMMTLYVLFEDIEAGRIQIGDEIKVSANAARQPASKLGIKAGSTIKVETAIEALVIKSANDVATAVAEHVSGSEVAFARRMTRTARDIGMRRTTFRNASGLPNSRQVTTARDMAKLARRLRQDFPEQQAFFAKTRFTWNGRTYRTHNKVMLTFKGATGLKTGYTRASGYNLATSAERSGHPLIGIVLGGRSGSTRNRHMTQIMDQSFSKIRQRPARIKTAFLRPPTPGLKPGAAPAPVALASANLPASDVTADDLNFQQLAQAVSTLPAGYEMGEGDSDLEELRNWSVQVGAYRQENQALDRLSSILPEIVGLAPSADRLVVPNRGRRGTLYRARFAQVTAAEAEAVCDILRPRGEDCLALPPGR